MIRLTLVGLGVLCLEIRQVRLILLILGRLFVLAQLAVIFVLESLSLALAWLLVLGSQLLPTFAHQLCDLGKRQIVAFDLVPYFYSSRQPSIARKKGGCYQRFEKMTYADGGRSGAYSSGYICPF